ncbi:hypothetical protein QL285_083131 [Trifolium repens]|nr:hypothetical protein QL285_083131 [Trifolium repens]
MGSTQLLKPSPKTHEQFTKIDSKTPKSSRTRMIGIEFLMLRSVRLFDDSFLRSKGGIYRRLMQNKDNGWSFGFSLHVTWLVELAWYKRCCWLVIQLQTHVNLLLSLVQILQACFFACEEVVSW